MSGGVSLARDITAYMKNEAYEKFNSRNFMAEEE